MDFNHIVKASLIFVIVTFFSCASAATTPHAIVCEQTYALCTSAKCLPDPNNAGKSLCECAVQQGKSAGFTTCDKRKPYLDQYRATHVISTFSFEQFGSKKSLSCPKGAPWSNCVDMPCTVDPQNSDRAICLCELNVTQAFFTFGGNCESDACTSGFWSGAIPGSASDALRNALNNGASNPVAPLSCSINAAG